MAAALLDLVDVFTSVVTFAIGSGVGLLAMTSKQRKDHKQTLYKNAEDHRVRKEERSTEFQNAIRSYQNGESIDAFHKIATCGDRYFDELRAIANAILTGSIDPDSCDPFVQDIAESLRKSIPAYYQCLHKLSEKIGGSQYSGTFTEASYKSLFSIMRKYDAMTEEEIKALLSSTAG